MQGTGESEACLAPPIVDPFSASGHPNRTRNGTALRSRGRNAGFHTPVLLYINGRILTLEQSCYSKQPLPPSPFQVRWKHVYCSILFCRRRCGLAHLEPPSHFAPASFCVLHSAAGKHQRQGC
jgi:hypothetical protein